MRCVLALALLLANLLQAGGRVNYCGAKMCGHSNTHTFCRYPPGASTYCVGYVAAPLSSDEKARILARLNRRRSEAASGRLGSLPAAGDMLKLRWVDELAREAQRWSDQCRPPQSFEEHDACRDLFGQCVASVVGEAPGLKVETMVDMWYMQSMYMLYKGHVTAYVKPANSVNSYGDFAQMVWANSYMVGCGRSRFMTMWNGRSRSVERLVCNIAPRGPLPGRPLWTPAPPASVCPPRSTQDPKLPTLCTFQAEIDVSDDVNGVMTIEEHILLSTVLEIETNSSLNYLGSLDETYLTKIAIVTMEDTGNTEAISYYNPMHKRDVLYRDVVSETTNETEIIDNQVLNETTTTIYKHENTEFVAKRIKIIGRPKTYDIEDLNDDQCENCLTTKQTNNLDQSARDKTIVDRDLYMDFSEASEQTENFVTSTARVMMLYIENTTHVYEVITETSLQLATQKYVHIFENLSSLVSEQLDSEKVIPLNSSMPVIVNKTADDDYMSDPETAKDIQEALERMENSLVDLSKAAGKVTRDVGAPYQNSSRDGDSPQPASDYSDRNKASDKAPMLSMVMKYLPYLKPYENDILGTIARSDASVGHCNIFLGSIVLVLFAYC